MNGYDMTLSQRDRVRDDAVKLRALLRQVRRAKIDARDFALFELRALGIDMDDIDNVEATEDAALDHHIGQAHALATALGAEDEDDCSWLLGDFGDGQRPSDTPSARITVTASRLAWPQGATRQTPYQAAQQQLERRRPPPDVATMEIPYGVDIDSDVAEASKHRLDAFWFYNQVKPGGRWDYKAHTRRKTTGANGETINPYEDFGNVHYGIVGRAAGVSPQVLLRGAGFNQENGENASPGFGRWYGGAPYGADPRDGEAIKLGIDRYAKQYRK